MTKSVTVIIPYNKDRGFLNEAIQSVKNQTIKCKLILSHSDKNLSYNTNRGIEKCDTKYWCYLHEDDLLPSDSIENRLKAINGYDFIHGHGKNFSNDNSFIVKSENTTPTVTELINKNTIRGGTGLYKTSWFNKVKFNETLLYGEELDFHLNMLKNGAKIGYCDKVVYNYRIHSKQKSRWNDLEQRNKRHHIIKNMRESYRY